MKFNRKGEQEGNFDDGGVKWMKITHTKKQYLYPPPPSSRVRKSSGPWPDLSESPEAVLLERCVGVHFGLKKNTEFLNESSKILDILQVFFRTELKSSGFWFNMFRELSGKI